MKRERAIAVLATGFAVGVACGLVADRHIAAVAILLFEPLLWVAVAVAATILAWRSGATAAAVAVSTVVAFSVGARLAVLDVSPPAPDARFARYGRCAEAPTPERARVATWNVLALNEDDAIVEAASAIDADVLVLHEVINEELGARIARAWNGHAIHEKAILDWGTTIVVRDGGFVPCHGRSHTVIELAAQARRRAIGIATVVEIRGGRFPLVTLHTDRPTTFGEAARWPDAMHASARRIAAAVRAIDHPAVVVTGDTNTHATFHRFHRTIESAGLRPGPSPRTWPAHLGGLPFVPLYSLDRLWTGPTWDIAGFEALRVQVPSDHLAIIADLRT